MTSVTQKIPNFAGGISQQPDELMPLGSVRDAVNVVPDVTDGLRKRTGSRLINPLLTDEEGTWFHFDYSPGLKYIGKIGLDGRVVIFNCQDGLPASVFYQTYDPTDDLTGSQIESGFPNCDGALVDSTRAAYDAKLSEKSVVEAAYNDAISRDGTIESQTYFSGKAGFYEEFTQVSGSGAGGVDRRWVPPRVDQGWYEYQDGTIFVSPQKNESDGWTSRRGRLAFKSTVGAYIADVLIGPGGQEIKAYEVIWERVSGRTNQAEVDALRAQLDVLNTELAPLKAAYDAALANCGFSQPGAPSTRDIVLTDVVPKYLQHEKGGQIRTLVVGDTIFLTNPRVDVSMLEGSQRPQRPTENFIELRTIAPAKVYEVEIVTPSGGPVGVSRVTAVEVSDGKFTTDGDEGCNLGGTQRETFQRGDKKNLDITLTISGAGSLDNDDDPVCNYIAEVKINNPGSGWEVGDIVEFEIKDEKYKVTVTEIETVFTAQGVPVTPAQTPSNGSVVEASTILADLTAAIQAEGFQARIVGNGIYVTHPDPEYIFSLSTPEGQLMKITTTEVNNISELPTQCVDGYLAKVNNTDSDFDDYWVEFETEYGGLDGPGAWVETIAPGYNKYINPAVMPHKIIRRSTGSFVVGPIEWSPRLVGDEVTNPRPSFISRIGKKDFRQINSMAFFRNRLCLLSGDNVICSQPGDYYNFWRGSALTLADNDPVDIAAGSTSTSANAALESSIEISEGLLCFSNAEQHVLSTDSELFGPRTARFARVGTYRYRGPNVSRRVRSDGSKYWSKTGTEPISLGNSIAFLHESGLHTTMLEMYNIGRTQEANVNDLTKPIPRYLPFGINSIADSKDNNIIALTVEGSQDVWVYRYFDNDQERQQSAWFRWTTLGKMLYQCIMDDVYWYVSVGTSSSAGIPVDERDIVSLQRIDLKDELATAFVRDKFLPSGVAGEIDERENNDRPYEAHLDNYRIAQPSEFTYYNHINQTYFRAPLVYYQDEVDKGNLVAYMLSPTQMQEDSELYGPNKPYYFVSIGSLVPIRVEEDNLGTWFVMDGDWSKTRMMIGYQYEMKVEFPTLYPTKSQPTTTGTLTKSDTSASLTLHRAKFNFGQNGVLECKLERKGRDVYTELYEAKIADGYPANEVAFEQERTQTVPIYAKNKDTRITLSSTHPSPATLVSMEWEGSYTNMYYKRV